MKRIISAIVIAAVMVWLTDSAKATSVKKPDTAEAGLARVPFVSVASGFPLSLRANPAERRRDPAEARSAKAGSRTVIAQTPPKQAVVETSAGTFVVDLAQDAAPNQTAHFMKLAGDGTYDRTIFHRVVKYGMVQAAIR